MGQRTFGSYRRPQPDHRGKVSMTKDACFFGGVGIGIMCCISVAKEPITALVMLFMALVFLAAAWFTRHPS